MDTWWLRARVRLSHYKADHRLIHQHDWVTTLYVDLQHPNTPFQVVAIPIPVMCLWCLNRSIVVISNEGWIYLWVPQFIIEIPKPTVICQYASYVPLRSPSFLSPLRHSHHASVIPVTSPSPPSLYFTYRSLSSFIVSPSFVFRLFLHYGSIPPLSCSEHHFSDLWLHYHTLTSSHSCGWTISLLSSWSYDLIT